jgi:hypothetical protein
MRVANQVESVKPAGRLMTSAATCIAVSMLAASAGLAQSSEGAQRTGVSRPSQAAITVDPSDAAAPPPPASVPAKPSAAVPAAAPETVYGPYVPYGGAPTPAAGTTAFDPDANIVTEETAGRADRRLLSVPTDTAAKGDIDAGIVTSVPSRPGEIPDGTLVRARLREPLSTLTTRPGAKFTAEVSEPVMRNGHVIVPVGSVLEGRVTFVRGGKRIGGPAEIHLDPRTVTLPDGAQYFLRARVIDTDRWNTTKVDSEGTILRRDFGKGTVAAMSLTTGGAMAAGAVMGGVPGALIGAGIGAGASAVVWLRQDRQAVLPRDLGLVFSLTEPMSVTPASAHVAQPGLQTPGGE